MDQFLIALVRFVKTSFSVAFRIHSASILMTEQNMVKWLFNLFTNM